MPSSHAASYQEAQLSRSSRDRLSSSYPGFRQTHRACKGSERQEAMQDGWAQRLRRELTEEWQAAADARPMPHNSARYTDTAWTLLPKTELWGLWTSLALERPSCLIPVLHTGWCGGKRSAGAWESYHRILISHNQQQGQAFH